MKFTKPKKEEGPDPNELEVRFSKLAEECERLNREGKRITAMGVDTKRGTYTLTLEDKTAG